MAKTKSKAQRKVRLARSGGYLAKLEKRDRVYGTLCTAARTAYEDGDNALMATYIDALAIIGKVWSDAKPDNDGTEPPAELEKGN